MALNNSSLRMSALHAFLGVIRPEMRLVKIKSHDDHIIVTVISECQLRDEILEDISIATTEIIADFPEANMIEEVIHVSTDALPREDVLMEGWIYQRWEPRDSR